MVTYFYAEIDEPLFHALTIFQSFIESRLEKLKQLGFCVGLDRRFLRIEYLGQQLAYRLLADMITSIQDELGKSPFVAV